MMGLLGVGLGTTFAAIPGLIVQAVPATETGSAMGFYQVVRYVGFSAGSALTASAVAAHDTPQGAPTVGGYTPNNCPKTNSGSSSRPRARTTWRSGRTDQNALRSSFQRNHSSYLCPRAYHEPMRTPAVIIRCCAAVLLLLYSIVVARLTLLPATSEHGIFAILDRAISLSNGHLTYSRAEVLANVALFVPAGFLLAVVVGRTWLSVVLCVMASAAIELAQQRYLPSRVPTIADVEHNGLGGALGALVAWPLARWVRLAGRRDRRPTPPPPPPFDERPTAVLPTRGQW
jgi:hypothetical protein